MEQQSYFEITGLQNVYLEDSYVLEIKEEGSGLRFLLELVLTEDHSDYLPPEPDEQYCYRRAWLVFPEARDICWLQKTMRPYRDANGRVDYGNIDVLLFENGRYHIEGDWGIVEVKSSAPTLKLLEGVEANGTNS